MKTKATLKKIFRANLIVVTLGFLIICTNAYAVQQAAPYKSVKRYSPSGLLLGEISADDNGDNANVLAKRYVYSTSRPGLLLRIEYGVLSTWQNDTVAPNNWSGFSIKKREVFTYDDYGRKATESLVSGNGSSYKSLKQYQYDEKGRVQCERIYMNSGNLNPANFSSSACASSVPAAGTYGRDRITEYEYNYLDQVTTVRKAVGTNYEQVYAEYTYDGYLKTSVTDANGNYAKLDYDKWGRLYRWYFPHKTNIGVHNTGDYEQYTYDLNNNRLTLRKRDTKVISYQYDKLNRVIKKSFSNGSTPVFYDYELNGLELHARFGSDTGTGVYRNYSGFGELQKESNYLGSTWYHTEHRYDAHGNREEIKHPDTQRFTYEYDGIDRQRFIRENGSAILITKTYEPNGLPDQITTGGGAFKNRNYDDALRLSSQQYEFATTQYDLTQTFGYNPAGQIHSFNVSKRVFHYEGTGGNTGDYQVNGLNQYTSISGTTVGHDANGNLTSDGTRSYTYDIENRMLTAGSATLAYDPVGRLTRYTVGSITTYFLWDGDSLIAEYQGGTLSKRYVHGGGLGIPLVAYEGSTVTTSARRFLHTNHQGSVIAHTNNSGSLSNSPNYYDAYGVPHPANNGRFGYTGQMFLKELDLYHYRARVYHPKIGRFLQTDPIGYEDQINLYGYVGNDPFNNIDPTGKTCFRMTSGLGTVCAGLGFLASERGRANKSSSVKSSAHKNQDRLSCNGRPCRNQPKSEDGRFAEDIYNSARENVKFGTTAKVAYGSGVGTSTVFTADGVANGDSTVTLDYVKGGMIQAGVYVRGDVFSSGEIDGFYQSGEACLVGCIRGAWDYQGNFNVGTKIVFPVAVGIAVSGGYATSGRDIVDGVTDQ